MKIVLGHYLNQAKQAGDRERTEKIAAVLRLQDVPPHDEERPDLDAVAEAWLDLIRDTWYVKLTQRRRFKPLRLSDIRKDLKNNPISTERILEAFSGIPSSLPIHTRVVSAIIGVPGSHG